MSREFVQFAAKRAAVGFVGQRKLVWW